MDEEEERQAPSWDELDWLMGNILRDTGSLSEPTDLAERLSGRDRRRPDDVDDLAREGRVTLVYGARDTEHNDAVVLADVLRRGRRST